MLTDKHCKNATCPADKKRVRFTEAQGLYLEVSPGGSKRWFWKTYTDGAYFGRCWTLISVSLGQRERREMDTQFDTRGHAQCAASRRRRCGAQLPCWFAWQVRGRLDFTNRPPD